jgi:hypothetical protein
MISRTYTHIPNEEKFYPKYVPMEIKIFLYLNPKAPLFPLILWNWNLTKRDIP